MEAKHIESIENFQNYHCANNLFVVITFNREIQDTETDNKKPDVIAVLSYDQL